MLMREPGNVPANTGFYLMRNTPPVRAFFREWAAQFRPGANDQVVANYILYRVGGGDVEVARSKRGGWGVTPRLSRSLRDAAAIPNIPLRWGLFSRSAVAGRPWHVTNTTIAYHAVNATDHVGKIAKVNQALAALRRLKPRRRAWQVECPSAEAGAGGSQVEAGGSRRGRA